jgi:hypothetical protein
MLAEWNILSEELQLAIAAEAIRKAAVIIANQAETLADEMDDGAIPDAGGPDALRLLAQIIRLNGATSLGAMGGQSAHGATAKIYN